jgi:hypothetical protein
VLVVLLCLIVLYLPAHFSFSGMAFQDSGSDLVLADLVAGGSAPGVDFGYLYGPLVPLLLKWWSLAFAVSPLQLVALKLAGTAAICWNLYRTIEALRPGWPVRLLFLVSLGHLVMMPYPSVVHLLEACCLTAALSCHVRGRLGAALAWATLAVFVKPGLGYFYGLLLVLWVLARAGKSGWRATLALFTPALLTAAVGASAVVLSFGLETLVRTILPLTASRHWAAVQLGLLSGSGWTFVFPPGARPSYWVGTEAGLFVVEGILLLGGLVAVVLAGWMARKPVLSDPAATLVIACATLHCIMVGLFFAHKWSFLNYAFLLGMGVLGVVALANRRSAVAGTAIATLLIAVNVAAYGASLRSAVGDWRTTAPAAEFGGLFLSAAEKEELERVGEILRGSGEKAVYFSLGGCGKLLPFVRHYDGWYPGAGMTTEVEAGRLDALLARHEYLLLPAAVRAERGGSLRFHRRAYAACFQGSSVTLYRRVPDGSPGLAP